MISQNLSDQLASVELINSGWKSLRFASSYCYHYGIVGWNLLDQLLMKIVVQTILLFHGNLGVGLIEKKFYLHLLTL